MGIFREMEGGTSRGRWWGWGRRGGRGGNNLTANDGMPGPHPRGVGLHTDKQLPKSI